MDDLTSLGGPAEAERTPRAESRADAYEDTADHLSLSNLLSWKLHRKGGLHPLDEQSRETGS
jgi:hypothetical protein